jgi:hypothetical protein
MTLVSQLTNLLSPGAPVNNYCRASIQWTWDQCTTVYTVYGNCGDDWSFRLLAAGPQAASVKLQTASDKPQALDKRQAS